MQLSNAISCFLFLAGAERRLSPRTVEHYAKALAKLEQYAIQHGRTRLEDFTPNLVRGAMAATMEEGHVDNWKGGESQAAAIVAASRNMCRRLQLEYPDLSLPDLSVLRAPKLPRRIQPRLEAGEFAKLEATLRGRLLRDRVPRFLIARDMAILAVLANTGLRANECCGLDQEDVDLSEGTLRVRRGKGNKWRILTVVDPDELRDGGEVIRALGDYLRYRERTFGHGRPEALWLTLRGNRLRTSGLRTMLNTLCEEAGVDGNRPPHAFRRAHFTEQYRAQPTALPVLVERMGWESETMAKVYTRGVDVELARRVPLPLMSKQWRRSGSQKVPWPTHPQQPILANGVSPGAGQSHGQVPPPRTKRTGPAPLR